MTIIPEEYLMTEEEAGRIEDLLRDLVDLNLTGESHELATKWITGRSFGWAVMYALEKDIDETAQRLVQRTGASGVA
jgi:hypothetical protein